MYCGEYFPSSEKRISVFKSGITSKLAKLTFINWENGRTGILQKDSTDRYWSAPSQFGKDVRQAVLEFERDEKNEIRHLILHDGTAPAVRAEKRSTFTQTDVSFANKDVVLSGVLKKPLQQAPFPAVVLVHGSGPGTHEQMELMARFFVHLGMAAISYDKRGCGTSGGNWKTVDLDVLADDALAAVSMLQSDPDIDPARIGLWGISQGGWITPLAAAQSKNVAFAINHSGPGISLRRQDTYMMTNVLSQEGIPAEDIDLVIAALNIMYDFGQNKASARDLDAAIDRLSNKPELADFAALSSRNLIPDSLYAQQIIGDPAWFFHLDPDRDALQPYRLLRCPILVVYGKLDYTVPVQESVEKITAALQESGHPDYLVRVLERTGHGSMVMQAEQPQKPVEPMILALEYFALVKEWLSQHGLPAPGRTR